VHLLNGLYDAKLDHVPVVAIVGQQQTSVLGAECQQEIDLQGLFQDVAAQYVQTVLTPEQAPMVLDRAFRTALATRSPCVVILPHDLQQEPVAENLPHEYGVVVTTPEWRRPHVLPRAGDLREAANVLNAGSSRDPRRTRRAREAQEQVRSVAERLGAGVTTSLLGKPWFDESLPYSCGVMGHLGTTASAWLMENCDTLLIVGSNDPWTEFYPPPGRARGVQVDLDGRHLGNRYPVEVGLTGDAADTLDALLPLLDPPGDRSWRSDVEASVRQWHEVAQERAALPANPLNPELVVRSLSARLPADAQVSVDVGSVTYWYARHLRLPPGVQAHLSSTLATMGSALPYGVAAKLAAPERPLVALVGDGAMQMNGIAELITVSRLWKSWTDPRFVVLVLRNGELAEVTWEQREMEGDPRFGQLLPDFRMPGTHGCSASTASGSTDPRTWTPRGTRLWALRGPWCWKRWSIPTCRSCRRFPPVRGSLRPSGRVWDRSPTAASTPSDCWTRRPLRKRVAESSDRVALTHPPTSRLQVLMCRACVGMCVACQDEQDAAGPRRARRRACRVAPPRHHRRNESL